MKTLPRLDETLDTLRRRIGLVLTVMSFGFMLAALLGMSQRPLYESREVIEAAAPRLAGADADADRLRGQVDGLVRAVTAGETLLSVAAAYDLFAAQPDLAAADQLAILQHAIRVSVTPEKAPVPLRVEIAARWNDPEQARLLAQEIGHRLVRESVLLRIAEAQAALEFHTAREASLQADLAAQERRLAEFRSANDAALATSDPAGMETLAILDARILAADQARQALDPGATAQAAALDRKRAALAAERRAQLRALAPPAALEDEQAALLTSLAGLTDQLEEATRNRRDADVALLAETRRMAERLTVARPAERPETPVQDYRRAFAFAGGLLSALIAVAFALFLDWRNPVVRTATQLRRLTSADTVVAVPRATPESRRPRNGNGPA